MLSARFRTLCQHLARALSALVERGQDAANALVAAGEAMAMERKARLARLMDRFEAGLLRPRLVGPRGAGPHAAGADAPPRKASVRAVPPWPAYRMNWISLIGHNHPSPAVRALWAGMSGGHFAARGNIQTFAAGLRAMVEQDAAMRGLLAASAQARRLTRWFLRSADADALPAILKEPPRKRPPRTATPRARRLRGAPVPPRKTRAAGPFEQPPENLTRDERAARGMYLPLGVMVYDPGAFPITPTWVQRGGRTWMD